MLISSNMLGDISLLNVYCGAAMIEVCLWSKKICDSMGFQAANRRRVDKVPDRRLFFCAAFTSYYKESDKRQTIIAKKPD